MKTYTVLYKATYPVISEPYAFCCEAVDTDHAEEQCLDAYPLHNIIWVVQTGNVEEAKQDYYTVGCPPIQLYEVLGGDGLGDQPDAWHGNVQVYASLIHAGQEALRDVVAEKIVFGNLPDDPDQAFYNLPFEETSAFTDTGVFAGHDYDVVKLNKVELRSSLWSLPLKLSKNGLWPN